MNRTNTLNITAGDVTGQRRVSVKAIPFEYTVGEVVDGLLPRLQLNRFDRGGEPIQFDARLEREGRHVHRTELAGDAFRPDDHLVLHPRIMAG